MALDSVGERDGAGGSEKTAAPAAFAWDAEGRDRIFVNNLRAIREQHGWSQTEFAKRAADRGLAFHQTTVQRIESGQRPLKMYEGQVLCSILGVDLHEMTLDESATSIFMSILDRYATVRRQIDDAVGAIDRELADLRDTAIFFRLSDNEYAEAVYESGETPRRDVREAIEAAAKACLAVRDIYGPDEGYLTIIRKVEELTSDLPVFDENEILYPSEESAAKAKKH